ncbi:MAG TPA: ABC transporter ATP-binding protein [Lachnospiraceae bacterium]|nr:ABC transporter ATP-binding protein [Lachnospiraceae bacterium]
MDRLTRITVSELICKYPIALDFLTNSNLHKLDRQVPFVDMIELLDSETLMEFGIDKGELTEQFLLFLNTFTGNMDTETSVDSLTIIGGHNKTKEMEDISLTIQRGEVISIVGPTGSGKSRLLGDIECLAQKDTPTARQILINGILPTEEERFSLSGRLVAQLSQNMNFVMDLSVMEFLTMHARSRLCEDTESVCQRCFACANELAGEKFSEDTKVTQLSGGQSRALMIADTAYMSSSPIVLIDEIENAGIDRKEAIKLLASHDKIVFMSTHDPLLALYASRRIVIRNGGIHKVLTTEEEEKQSLSCIEGLDRELLAIRNRLRLGERISLSETEAFHVATL